MCDLCVVWHYQPCDMYIHLHMIGLIGVTELGTVTFHFAPNRRRFHWSISWWIFLCRTHVFGKSLKSSLSLFVASFRFFQHLSSMISPFYWAFLTEIGPWPRSCYKEFCSNIHVAEQNGAAIDALWATLVTLNSFIDTFFLVYEGIIKLLKGVNVTHWGRVTHIRVSKVGHHWFR